MTIDTEWIPLSVEAPAAAIDSPHLYGVWMQLASQCWKRRTGGRIENALEALSESSPKQSFLLTWGISAEWVPWLLESCEFWQWEGDTLVLQNYPADEEANLVAQKRLAREYGRKGARKRWPDNGKIGSSKRDKESTPQQNSGCATPARGTVFDGALSEVAAKLEPYAEATEEEKEAFFQELREVRPLEKAPS